MAEQRPGISFLRNIGMMITYKCQAACPHCVVEAGPNRKEEITLEDAFDWIDQIALYRKGHIKALSLTGGEPFWNLDKLKAIIGHSNEKGLFVSTITNGFWASGKDEAERILHEVDGLKMIGISADPHHQNFIPLGNVLNVVNAASEFDLPYKVIITTEDETSREYLDFRAGIDEKVPQENIQLTITFPAGRAALHFGANRRKMSELPYPSRCESAGAPVIFPDGKIISCIGALIALKTPHPLVLGNLRQYTLAEILDRSEVNSILHCIRTWGPGRLISLIGEKGGGDELPDQYIENVICDPCYKIMADNRLLSRLEDLSNDPEFIRMVAYGRVFHLKETEMLDFLNW